MKPGISLSVFVPFVLGAIVYAGPGAAPQTPTSRNTTPEAPSGTTAASSLGYALVISAGADEYIVAGKNVQIAFSPNPPAQEVATVASIDEGTFVDGQWVPCRRFNGDETMLTQLGAVPTPGQQSNRDRSPFGVDKPSIYRIKVVRYPASAVPALK